jgi:hypothetical protein
MEDIAPVLIIVGLGAITFAIVRTFMENRTRRRLAELRASLHRDLVSKFGTSQELLAYLGSEAGRDLVVGSQQDAPMPFKRILGAVQTGIVLVAVGTAFLLLRNVSGVGNDGETGFTFLGGMALAVGLGFLGSATAAWVLSRHWGLIELRPRLGAGSPTAVREVEP